MNNTTDNFSAARFGAYFTKLIVERWRTNALRMGILFGCMVIIEMWMASATYDSYSWDYDSVAGMVTPVFAAMFLLSGCFFASEMLSGARRKAERIGALTFPVTPFENWLARWTICIPLFLVCFLACMYAADALRVVTFSAQFPNANIRFISVLPQGSFEGIVLGKAWLCYFWLTAAYALGSVLSPKRSILKTSVTLFILFWIIAFIVFGLTVIGDTTFGRMSDLVLEGYGWLSVPFLWWLSYYSFKEMDVVDDFSFSGSGGLVMGYTVFSLLVIGFSFMLPDSIEHVEQAEDIGENPIYMDRTTEQRITPVKVIVFTEGNEEVLTDVGELSFSIQVNYVDDASKCTVIYPEQILQVHQRGDTLYYTFKHDLYKQDEYNLNLVYGPDGMTSIGQATDAGQITYQIKGADGKVRKAIDKHFSDRNAVRLVVNTLPGTLVVSNEKYMSVYVGAGKTTSLAVDGPGGVELNSSSQIHKLSLRGVNSLELKGAKVNSLEAYLMGQEGELSEGDLHFEDNDSGIINHMVVNGNGKIYGLSKYLCKRIELLPDKKGQIGIQLNAVKDKMVIE